MQKRKYIIAGFILFVCLGIVLLFAVSMFKSNMVLPEQPRLTDREKGYFDTLQKQCICKVTREVDTRKPDERPHLDKNGFYTITLDNLSCNVVGQKDSLRNVGKLIAERLHSEVLGDKYEYPYRNITVMFSCATGTDQFLVETFELEPPESEARTDDRFIK